MTKQPPTRAFLPIRCAAAARDILLVASCAAALALANCGDGQLAGSSSNINAARGDPGSAPVSVLVLVASPRRVDRVTLEVRPANVTLLLTFDDQRGGYAAALSVPAATQTFRATAYAGKTRVGYVEAEAPLWRDAPATIFLRIVDTSAGWPLPTKGPAITAFATTPTTVAADQTVAASAKAMDPNRAPIELRWVSACDGTFTPPATSATIWRPGAAGPCDITVHAISATGRDTRSAAVTVLPLAGTVAVTGEFVPWPQISSVTIDAAAGACAIGRAAPNASCGVWVTAGEQVVVGATVDAAGDVDFTWTSDCGGRFERVAETFPGTATYIWFAPTLLAADACVVTPSVSLLGMADAFPVAIVVTP